MSELNFGDNATGTVFLTTHIKGKECHIGYDELKKYFSDALPDIIERAGYYYDESVDCIVANYTTAAGQAGGIFLWNVNSKQVTHVSDGAFAVKCAVHNNKLYTLRLISFYGHIPELSLDSCNLDLKTNKKYNKYNLNIALDTDSHFDSNNYTLEIADDVLRAGYKGNIQELKIS